MSAAEASSSGGLPLGDTPGGLPAADVDPRRGGTVRALAGSPVAVIGIVLVLVHVIVALAAPLIAPYSPIATDPMQAITNPSGSHWLGTDQLGRDVLSRVIYGGRNAMVISLVAALLSVGIGTALGCAAAYFRGWFDEILMRILDAVLSVPAILALLVVVSLLGAGAPVIVLAATVVYCPAVIRVVRAAALSVVGLDYVTAARARGERPWATMVREILPNVLDVVLVEFAMRASWIVLLVSSLSFLASGRIRQRRTGG